MGVDRPGIVETGKRSQTGDIFRRAGQQDLLRVAARVKGKKESRIIQSLA